MNLLSLKRLLFVLLFLLSASVNAQWRQMVSPVQGIKTFKLKVVGTRIYALTNQGPYLTDNEGTNWVGFTGGLPVWDNTMEYRAMDAASDRIVVGTSTGKVYSATPFTSFSDISAGLPGGQINAAQVVGGVIVVGLQQGGLYRSANNGATWQQGTINSSTLAVNNLHFGSNVLFATTDNGVYSSADTGKTWTARSAGLTNLNTIAITNSGDQLITSTPSGLFTSTISAPTWVAATPTGVTGTVEVILKFLNKYILGVRGEKTCLVGDDLNGTFTQSKSLPKNGGVLTLAAKGSRTFAGIDGGGVYLSENLGSSWILQSYGLPTQVEINRLVLTSISLFASTKPLAYGRSSGGILVLSKVGITKNNWQLLGTPTRTDQTGSNMLTFDFNYPYILAGGENQGILRSNDFSSTWTASSTGIPAGNEEQTINQVRMLSQNRVIAGTGKGVVFSTDTGYNWTKTLDGTLSGQVWDFEKIDEVIFAATEKGIFKTLDSGETWSAAGLSNTAIRALSKAGSVLYAASATSVHRSDNNGGSWQDISIGLTVTNIRDILASNNRLLIGHGSGIEISENDGQSWQSYSDGLAGREVTCLIDSANILYAGLGSGGAGQPGGIWRRNVLLPLSTEPLVSAEQSQPLMIRSLYPNPSSGNLTITSTAKAGGAVVFEVCDLRGRILLTRKITRNEPGLFSFSFDTQLQAGVYFIRLRQGQEQATARFVVQ